MTQRQAIQKSKQEDVYYAAMLARDQRFDGKFFVGVKTTGVYCRPICPARPKRKNVEFFNNRHEAEKNGYRPCLRCRPESAPLSPAWIGKSAVVRRAVKLLHDPVTIEFDEGKFAEQFGVSARHLRRLFIEEIGKTPKQLSSENRLNLSRQLIVETALPMIDIAFASGFGSVRRFNDAFKQRFKRSPREIRRQKVPVGSGVKITLAYRPPYDFESLVKFYESHRVGNLEWTEGSKWFRVVEINGQVGQIAVSNDPQRMRLIVDIDFPNTAAIQNIVSRVRSLFDVDSDPLVIANTLETDEKVKTILEKHSGLRLPSGWDPFEVAVGTILGQVVSVEQGSRLVHDLIELLGSEITLSNRKIKLFPTPREIVNADLSSLKTTKGKKATLKTFAKAVLNGELSLAATQDIEAFRKQVLDLPGVGEWTANYITLRALRHADAFPHTDLILARALSLHSKELLDRMSPWRGYLAILFWREYAHVLKKTKGVKNGES